MQTKNNKPKFDALDLRAFEKIDSVLHSKVRLSIVSVLAVHESLSFTELRDGLKLTDGNLAAHLRALLAEGILRQKKVGKVLVDSRTGSNLLYLPLDKLIQQSTSGTSGATSAQSGNPEPAPTPPSAGWRPPRP